MELEKRSNLDSAEEPLMDVTVPSEVSGPLRVCSVIYWHSPWIHFWFSLLLQVEICASCATVEAVKSELLLKSDHYHSFAFGLKTCGIIVLSSFVYFVLGLYCFKDKV